MVRQVREKVEIVVEVWVGWQRPASESRPYNGPNNGKENGKGAQKIVRLWEGVERRAKTKWRVGSWATERSGWGGSGRLRKAGLTTARTTAKRTARGRKKWCGCGKESNVGRKGSGRVGSWATERFGWGGSGRLRKAGPTTASERDHIVVLRGIRLRAVARENVRRDGALTRVRNSRFRR
jgi:hypothetical protein